LVLGDAPDGGQQIENSIVSQSVIDELPFASRGDEPDPAHMLKMLGCVGDRDANPIRKHFDAPLALRELFEQREPMRMSHCFRDGRKLREQR
jgi:hypothetical protein